MIYRLFKIGLLSAVLLVAGIAYPQIASTRNENGIAVTMAIRDVDLRMVIDTMFASTVDVYRVKYEDNAVPFLAGRVSRMDVKGMPFDLALRRVFDDASVPLDFAKAAISTGMQYTIFAKAGATYNIPNPPQGLDPLNQPPRQPNPRQNDKNTTRNPLQPTPPVAFDLQPDPVLEDDDNIPVIGPPENLGDPVIDNGIPGPTDTPPVIDPNGGNPPEDTNTDFLPEPEKKTENDPTSVTKPASQEYFVRIIPVSSLNLGQLSKSLGVKTANINDSRSSGGDWWASGSGSTSTGTSTGTNTGTSTGTGTSGSFGSNKAKDVQEDITRLMTLYQAVDYDYQTLYTQAFNMNALKNSSITSAIRALRNKHDKLASDIQDRWRLSDSNAINAMQDRVMRLQADIDDIRTMDDSLKNPMAQQQNQTPQYDSSGNIINTNTGTDLNSQLQLVQTAYQQATAKFANEPRYRTQLNKVKTSISTAQSSILSNAGKKGTNKTATKALQTAADTLTALGVPVSLGNSSVSGNPLLNQMANPYGTQQQYNPYGTQQQYNPYGTQQQYNPYGTQQQQYNPYGTQQQQYNPYGTQQQQYNPYGTQQQQYNPYGTQQQYNPYGTQTQQYNPYGTQTTGTDPRTQFSQLEASYNSIKSQSTGTLTTAQRNELNSIMNTVNTLRGQVNNQNYINNPANLNNLNNSMTNLQSKISNYQSTYNVNGTVTNSDGTTTTTANTELETLRTTLNTSSTDIQGIDDAIRNFNATQFTKITNIYSNVNNVRSTINQTQLDMMNTNPNISNIRSRVTQVQSRIVQIKRDVYSVQQDVLNYSRTQLNTLTKLVNSSIDVVKNQYSGQVDTHNTDLRDIESDFNTSSYIQDPANQKDWATRILDLMSSIEATRANVLTAIANNK